jgi:hypothetical protein
LVASLRQLGHEGKTLIVDSLDNDNLILSTRNVQSAKVVNSFALNIYDLLYHEKLIISEAAVKELEQLLGPGKADQATEAVEQVEAAPVANDEPAKPKRVRKPKAEATPEADSEVISEANSEAGEATE